MEQLLFEDITRSERQEQGVQKWVNNHCNGTLCYATGVGKTRCGLIAISRFLAKNKGRLVIIVVPSDPIKQQWLDELDKWGLLADNISVHTMYESSKKEYVCDMLVIDEQKHEHIVGYF